MIVSYAKTTLLWLQTLVSCWCYIWMHSRSLQIYCSRTLIFFRMTKCCRRYKKAGYITHLSLQSSNWILLKYTTAKIVVFVSPNTFTYFSLSVFGYQNEHELSVNNNLNYVCFYFGQQELTLHYPFLLAMTSFLHFCAQNNQWIFLCFIFKQCRLFWPFLLLCNVGQYFSWNRVPFINW